MAAPVPAFSRMARKSAGSARAASCSRLLKVTQVECHNRLRCAVHGCFKYMLISRVPQLRPPQKKGRHRRDQQRHAIEKMFNLICCEAERAQVFGASEHRFVLQHHDDTGNRLIAPLVEQRQQFGGSA